MRKGCATQAKPFLSFLILSPAYLLCFYTDFFFIHIPIRDNVSTMLPFKDYTQKCQTVSYRSCINILTYRSSLFLFHMSQAVKNSSLILSEEKQLHALNASRCNQLVHICILKWKVFSIQEESSNTLARVFCRNTLIFVHYNVWSTGIQ